MAQVFVIDPGPEWHEPEKVAPTMPSELWPQTVEARMRGCTCPVEENEKRLRGGQPPVFTKNCRVHNKLCQAEVCGHGEHTGAHFRCEHCTNMLHICVVCEAVYLEDGDRPELFGWRFESNDSAIIKGWKCRTCA